MFRLRQSTRRRICRAAFVLGCLAPTASFATWGTYRHSELHIRHEQRALRTALGLRATIKAVQHPRPGLTRLCGVELTTAEGRQAFAGCEFVELRQAFSGDGADLTMRGLTIRDGGLSSCYLLVDQLLRHELGADDLNVNLALLQVSIQDGGQTFELSRASGSIRGDGIETPRETRLTLLPTGVSEQAAQTGDKSADRILLRFARRLQQETPLAEWELHTGTQTVPREWLAALAGSVLGNASSSGIPGTDASRFQGSVWAKSSTGGWQAAVRGRMTQVDLGALVRNHFGRPLEGSVTIDLDPAQIQNGRLLEVRGRMRGGPGAIGAEFLTAFAGSLGCAFDERSVDACREDGSNSPGDARLAYGELALQFTIDAQGQLSIDGQCDGKPGVILTAATGQPLLAQPQRQPLSDLALVRALAGEENPTVPATPEAARLVGWLPQAATPQHTTASRPRATVPRAGNAPPTQRRYQ